MYNLIILFEKIMTKIIWKSAQKQLGKCGVKTRVEWPFVMSGFENIYIGDNFSARKRLQLETFSEILGEKYSPLLRIGDNVSINYDVHISAINRVEIGNNVLIASKVYIADHSHGETKLSDLEIYPSKRKIVSKGPVVINDNVWIGEGAIVLPGVEIGANSVIGANAVVTKSFPAYSIIAGCPAKVIK